MADSASAGLVCTQLTKSYAGITVLKGIDFTLPPATVIGLIGENGAGKSTLSSLITGVRLPDSGSMTLDGAALLPRRPGRSARRRRRLDPPGDPAAAGADRGREHLPRPPPPQGRSHRPRADGGGVARGPRPARRPRRPRPPGPGLVDGRAAGDRDRQGDHPQAALHHLRRAVGLAGRPGDREGPRPDPRAARPGRRRRLHLHRLDEVREVADGIVCLRDGAGRRLAHRRRAGGTSWSTPWSAASSPSSTSRPSRTRRGRVLEVRGLGRQGSSPTSTSPSPPARCSASPGWSAPDAPRSCGPSPAPTAPTPAR